MKFEKPRASHIINIKCDLSPTLKEFGEKVEGLLVGSFFRAKLGIDPNGYNRIAEVLPPKSNETNSKPKITEQV